MSSFACRMSPLRLLLLAVLVAVVAGAGRGALPADASQVQKARAARYADATSRVASRELLRVARVPLMPNATAVGRRCHGVIKVGYTLSR